MKNLFINCILASLALLAVLSCRQEDEVVVEPRLDMVTDSVIAEPDGGHYVIEYVLSNPVEGVSVVASSAQNWITDFVYEDGRIGFDVGGNTEVSSREGLVRVTYGDYMGFDVPVCQAAAGYAGYEMAADYFFGTYYGDMYGESYNFYVILSDTTYPGVVVKLDQFKKIVYHDEEVVVGAGVMLNFLFGESYRILSFLGVPLS